MSRLSHVQKVAIRRLAGDWVRGEPLTKAATYRSLRRRGLAAYDFRSGTGGWHLTDDGQQTYEEIRAAPARRQCDGCGPAPASGEG